ncbi:hypothetical protein EMCRGX_G006764 [Ephydatia muelleri]
MEKPNLSDAREMTLIKILVQQRRINRLQPDAQLGAHLRWKDIGRQLKMGHTETSSIVTTPGLTQTKDYFQELLHRWLKRAPPIHPFPTTEDLADALRGAGSENIAYKLAKHNDFMSAARASN